MQTLTADQAAKMRGLRPRLYAAYAAAADLRLEAVVLCRHTGNDPDCPACELWSALDTASGKLERAVYDLDTALERGPHPAAA